MELEEMKNIWTSMDQKLEKQINLTDQLVLSMTEARYKERVDTFWNAQILGFIVAYSLIIFLVFNVTKLDNGLEWTSFGIWIIYLAIMPFYSIIGIGRMKDIEVGKMTFKESLSKFISGKKRIFKAQTISLILNPILFGAALVLITGLFPAFDKSKLWNMTALIILIISLVVSMILTYRIYQKNNRYLASLEGFIEETERK